MICILFVVIQKIKNVTKSFCFRKLSSYLEYYSGQIRGRRGEGQVNMIRTTFGQ